MYTSYYGNKSLNNTMNLICVSNSKPSWFRLNCREAKILYPGWDLVKQYKRDRNEYAYSNVYNRYLNELNVEQIVKAIRPDGILLCWERPGEFCHRYLIAEWIERETGIKVAEL